MPSKISDAILKTLKYSDHFDFPLTEDEIFVRLVGQGSSRTSLSNNLDKLINSHKILKKGDYYHLPGRSQLVALRRKNFLISTRALSRARFLAKKLSIFPGVLAVYLTGSLAVLNSSTNSDIDFMIITKNNRLWTTRFILTIYTELLGLRRRPRSTSSSQYLCLNLYLCPKSFSIPKRKRSLYTAYELIQAVPLYDPKDTRSQLLQANKWIKQFLPNFPLPSTQADLSQSKSRAGMLENILFHLQLLYMRRKITTEYITRDSAFFHPQSPAKDILTKLS